VQVCDQLRAVEERLEAPEDEGPTASKAGTIAGGAGAITARIPSLAAEVRVLVSVTVTVARDVGAEVVRLVAIWDAAEAVVLVWTADPPDTDQVFVAEVVPLLVRPATTAMQPAVGTTAEETGAMVFPVVPVMTPLEETIGVLPEVSVNSNNVTVMEALAAVPVQVPVNVAAASAPVATRV